MATSFNPENADFVALRAGEQLYVWLNADGSADFGTIAENGAPAILHGRIADAVQHVNAKVLQGWKTSRFSPRWQQASADRQVNGTRRRAPLVSFADYGPRHVDSQPLTTVSIYQQDDNFMLMTVENGEPSWHAGDLKAVLAEMFDAVKPGWQLARVTPEFLTLVETRLANQAAPVAAAAVEDAAAA